MTNSPTAPAWSVDLRDYIKIFDDVLPPGLASDMIARFEEEKGPQQPVNFGEADGGFTQMQISTLPHWNDFGNILMPIFVKAAQAYAADLGVPPIWPQKPQFEQIRMKRYLPNGRDQFPKHVDAIDIDTARRFLIMFLYLNDVEEGGETGFPDWGIKVQPKADRLLMFPPFWLYPHTGEPPKSGPKYIIGTYLHFPPREPLPQRA